MAVCMDMLEFVSELFVHVAPNERAWAATLTKYLDSRGYCFSTKVCKTYLDICGSSQLIGHCIQYRTHFDVVLPIRCRITKCL